MRRSMLMAGLAMALCASPLHAASKYAENCARVIGVPVPDVDCSDPNGTEIPNTGGDKCNNPAHGDSECYPGTKFIRFTDTFKRPGSSATETVVTMMMCRKTRGDTAISNIYSDIGVIQYNETKHAACWFSSTTGGQTPDKEVTVNRVTRRVYPSPTTEAGTNGFWNAQPRATCVGCHQNEVWLRTPFAMSAPYQADKGYRKSGTQTAYATGGGNAVPDTTKISRRGLPCSVGVPAWNLPGGDAAPRQVKINSEAYVAMKGKPLPPGHAPAGACTACHYFGAKSGGMGCSTFLPELATGSYRRRNDGAPFLNKYWMPPSGELTSPPQTTAITNADQYSVIFSTAFEALAWCCNDANAGNGQYDAVCGAKFGTDDSRSFNNNSCALCPGCGAAPR